MQEKQYQDWVQTKLSPTFHQEQEDENENELRTIIEDFIRVGNRLDIMKKRKWYGRLKGHEKFEETGVEIRNSDFNFRKEDQQEQILHSTIGMATEVVEMLEVVLKHKWYGREFDQVNFLEELGDLEFYKSIPNRIFGWDDKKVRETNYFKLEKRYPEGYTDNSANERDLKSEREILEQSNKTK